MVTVKTFYGSTPEQVERIASRYKRPYNAAREIALYYGRSPLATRWSKLTAPNRETGEGWLVTVYERVAAGYPVESTRAVEQFEIA